MSQAGPVLLGGEHRSGTTLLSVVLDSHRDLEVGPELDFAEPHNLGTFVVEVCHLLERADPRVLGKGTDTTDPYFYDGAHFVKQCQRFGIDPPVLAAIVQSELDRSGRDIVSLEDRCALVEAVARHKAATTGKSRWGIKLQRKVQDIDVYAEIWPTARFVHIIRDGRDVAASHLRTVPDWGYKTIDDTAYQWSNLIRATRARAPRERYLEVRYEDLVADPEPTCRTICTFLDVEYDAAMSRHDRSVHSLHAHAWSHPSAEATSQPLSDQSIGRFREDLDPAQVRAFEDIAGATLVRCGYTLESNVSLDHGPEGTTL